MGHIGARRGLFHLGNHYVPRLPLYSWQTFCFSFSNVGITGMWQDIPVTAYFNVSHWCNCPLNGIYEVSLYPKVQMGSPLSTFFSFKCDGFYTPVALVVIGSSSSAIKKHLSDWWGKNLFSILSLSVKCFLELLYVQNSNWESVPCVL